jgi:hypothetical protein
VKSATEVSLELKMCHCTECMTALEQAMAEARAEALEEAVRIIDAKIEYWRGLIPPPLVYEVQPLCVGAAEVRAGIIRALSRRQRGSRCC